MHMIDEAKMKKLLHNTKTFQDLADEYEDESMLDINHKIYDSILDELGIENDFYVREIFYDIFVEYHFDQIDEDTVINRLKILKKNP